MQQLRQHQQLLQHQTKMSGHYNNPLAGAAPPAGVPFVNHYHHQPNINVPVPLPAGPSRQGPTSTFLRAEQLYNHACATGVVPKGFGQLEDPTIPWTYLPYKDPWFKEARKIIGHEKKKVTEAAKRAKKQMGLPVTSGRQQAKIKAEEKRQARAAKRAQQQQQQQQQQQARQQARQQQQQAQLPLPQLPPPGPPGPHEQLQPPQPGGAWEVPQDFGSGAGDVWVQNGLGAGTGNVVGGHADTGYVDPRQLSMSNGPEDPAMGVMGEDKEGERIVAEIVALSQRGSEWTDMPPLRLENGWQ
ncbi:hypothetical protein QBC41DRAFT_388360 [Cercophora samala]|uniref:Uncharacterized protein n=1 Tax=Cercophora samala TaxID=330535 RepID=A0AA39ZMZ1_9PEZI|nr:hypothetical protein QBC41DRAFT_388360 [Cercophora samala]